MNDAERRARVEDLGARISDCLEEVRRMYREDVRITLIVRNPFKADGSRDTVLTDDDPEKAVAALRSLYADPEAEIYPTERDAHKTTDG